MAATSDEPRPARSSPSPPSPSSTSPSASSKASRPAACCETSSLLYFGTILFITLLTLYISPPVDQEECKDVSVRIFFGAKNPKEVAKKLLGCGDAYYQQHPISAILLYSVLYTAFLALSIPGCTTILSILAGAIWHPVVAVLLIVINSSFGALCAYLLSHLMLRETVIARFPSLFTKLRKSIESFESNVWFAMIFLRVTPLVPNWFVSLGSPLTIFLTVPFVVCFQVGMPLHIFFFGGMIGFIPAGIFHCMNGRALKFFATDSGVDPLTSFITLFGLQFVVLLPLWLCGKRKASQLEEQIKKDGKPKKH